MRHLGCLCSVQCNFGVIQYTRGTAVKCFSSHAHPVVKQSVNVHGPLLFSLASTGDHVGVNISKRYYPSVIMHVQSVPTKISHSILGNMILSTNI